MRYALIAAILLPLLVMGCGDDKDQPDMPDVPEDPGGTPPADTDPAAMGGMKTVTLEVSGMS